MDKQVLAVLVKSISVVFLGALVLSMAYNVNQSVELVQSLVNSVQVASFVSVYYLALAGIIFVIRR